MRVDRTRRAFSSTNRVGGETNGRFSYIRERGIAAENESSGSYHVVLLVIPYFYGTLKDD